MRKRRYRNGFLPIVTREINEEDLIRNTPRRLHDIDVDNKYVETIMVIFIITIIIIIAVYG